MKIGDKVRVKADGREGRITNIKHSPEVYFLGGCAFYADELELITETTEIKTDADLFKALLEGKKVRHRNMCKGDFLQIIDGVLRCSDGYQAASTVTTCNQEWEIYTCQKKVWIAVYTAYTAMTLFESEEAARRDCPNATKYIEVTLD